MGWLEDPISHGYIPFYSPNIGDSPHYAVDIATPLDTPITSPFNGTVVQADYATWSGQPGGGEVFIKSPNIPGGQEFYVYHLDQIDPGIVPGAIVDAGQELGLSGGQNSGGSHPTSSMWSSGPHTHVGFFSGYKSTPVGSRPYGTDITNYIADWSKSGYDAQVAVPPSNDTTGSDPTTAATEMGFQKVILFSLAGLFLIAGLLLLFKNQIQQLTQKGEDLAVKAAMAGI